ncbi:MAG: dephospho-CoA kinase [Propionibacteriaceae bacterium]
MTQFRVALTGGIGSGKTAVSDKLGELGATVIDSDLLAREVVAPGTPGLAAVVDRFGSDLVTTDGALDRAALGQLVFAEPVARRDLEAIIHPLVRQAAAARASAAPADAVVVQVIPLLVETGQQGAFDLVVVVDVDPATQLSRVIARGGVDATEAARRIAAQASREQRLVVADVVIDNSGDRRQLDARVERWWADLVDRPVPR